MSPLDIMSPLGSGHSPMFVQVRGSSATSDAPSSRRMSEFGSETGADHARRRFCLTETWAWGHPVRLPGANVSSQDVTVRHRRTARYPPIWSGWRPGRSGWLVDPKDRYVPMEGLNAARGLA